VLNDNVPGLRIEVRVTRGSVDNMRLLHQGDVQLALAQNDTPALPRVRAVSSLFPEVLHLIVADDSGVSRIPELKGKRIAVMPNLLGEESVSPTRTSDPRSFFYRFVGRYGLRPRDFATVTPQSIKSSSASLRRGEVDAVFLFIGVGNRGVGELLTQTERPASLIPLECEATRTWHPFVEKTLIPQGAYWGDPPQPGKDISSLAVRALLLTHEAVPKDVIHEVTKSLYEYRNALLRENPHAYSMSYPDSGDNLGIPLHRGARAYYNQNVPGFLVEYAEVIALGMSVAALCASGLWQLRLRFQQRQKTRADMYNTEILKLVEEVHSIESLRKLAQMRRRLIDIFTKVVEDLNRDRITVETFNLFAFPWEMAIGAMRHRELILYNMLLKEDAEKEK
jgi:TRAP transporter TAXI family solute receptor